MAKKDKSLKINSWLPLGGLVCVLILLYIFNVHRVEKKIRTIDHLHSDIEELRREHFSVMQKSWYDGTLNQVAKKVDGVDIKNRVAIPKKIDKPDV